MTTDFPPGDRTYFVSDERLRAFRELTPEQKLRWIEELAMPLLPEYPAHRSPLKLL